MFGMDPHLSSILNEPLREREPWPWGGGWSDQLPKVIARERLLFFIYLFFLGLHPQHIDVPRLGVEAEVQLPAYATVTATSDPSPIFVDLHRSLWQHQILIPLSEVRDQTRILTETTSGPSPAEPQWECQDA